MDGVYEFSVSAVLDACLSVSAQLEFYLSLHKSLSYCNLQRVRARFHTNDSIPFATAIFSLEEMTPFAKCAMPISGS